MRGGSGASGVLGYDFNIITGAQKEDPHTRLKATAPRISRNVTELVARGTDGWGDSDHKIDLISGKVRPAVSAALVYRRLHQRD
jgi:hypothetical protein